MKAIVCTGYGAPEVLRLREVATPVPKPDEVRIRIRATAVTSSDCIIRSFSLPPPMWLVARLVLGIRRPRRILGMVLAGDVESVGDKVTAFKLGDAVFAFDRFRFGAYAEYKCMPQDGVLAGKPGNLTYEGAAAIPYGGLLALYFLRKGKITAGQRVLVYGASSAVGSSALQLARHFGTDVTGVCSSANLGLVKSLGADTVIDYTMDDFKKRDDRYDLIFVAVGNRVRPPSRAECQQALSPGGMYVAVDEGRPKLLVQDLVMLKQLAEAGQLKPVIDRSYPLNAMVEAHRYVDEGHKKGNVVIDVP